MFAVMRCWLLAHGVALVTGLQVTAPTLAGEFEDTPADFAPANYNVTALGVVATSCPCEWAAESSPIQEGALTGRILIVTDGVCNTSCTAKVAACAAQLANASGVLVTQGFNPTSELFSDRPTAEGASAATDAELNASCEKALIPAAYVTPNTSSLLAFIVLEVTDPAPLTPASDWKPGPHSTDALRTPASPARPKCGPLSPRTVRTPPLAAPRSPPATLGAASRTVREPGQELEPYGSLVRLAWYG